MLNRADNEISDNGRMLKKGTIKSTLMDDDLIFGATVRK